MKTALVVDDSASIRMLVSHTLIQAGFRVVEGANGAEALDRLDEGPVTVVITDVNMPVMDGLTFVRNARQRTAGKFVPILMLTTESSPERKAEGKAAGATGWLVKPFNPAQLLQVIARVVP